MSKYIQLYERKLDGSVDELLGSSGCIPIDGRIGLEKQLIIGENLVKKNRYAVGFKICNGLYYNGFKSESKLYLVNK